MLTMHYDEGWWNGLPFHLESVSNLALSGRQG